MTSSHAEGIGSQKKDGGSSTELSHHLRASPCSACARAFLPKLVCFPTSMRVAAAEVAASFGSRARIGGAFGLFCSD